jgi:hypothetical protein
MLKRPLYRIELEERVGCLPRVTRKTDGREVFTIGREASREWRDGFIHGANESDLEQ